MRETTYCIYILKAKSHSQVFKVIAPMQIRCKLIISAWCGGISCADYTLASVSIERAIAVCFPLRVRRSFNSLEHFISHFEKLSILR